MRHGVAVVVVGDVVAPVEKARPILAGMRFVPPVDIHHAVAAVDFDHRRDEHDHVRADVLDVGRVVDGQAIGQLHQRRGRAGLGRVDGAGDVVDGPGLVDELARFGVIEADRARVGKLGQARVILFRAREQFRIGDGGGDHLAAFFGVADGEDLYPRAAGLQHAEVLVHIFGVGKHVGRAGDIAQHLGRRGDGFRGGKVIHQRRDEGRVGGVFANLVGVLLIDGLAGIAGESLSSIPGKAAARRRKTRWKRRRASPVWKGSFFLVLIRFPRVHAARIQDRADRQSDRNYLTVPTSSPNGSRLFDIARRTASGWPWTAGLLADLILSAGSTIDYD